MAAYLFSDYLMSSNIIKSMEKVNKYVFFSKELSITFVFKNEFVRVKEQSKYHQI